MNKRVFLSAQWRKLAIANFPADPKVLEKYLPAKTELDVWKNKYYVSLVGFRFVDTRVRGIKIPFHTHFEEVNLRFYVRHFDGREWKRGVVFVKEIVPKSMITWVANTLYKEKYQTMPMKHHWREEKNQKHFSYSWYKNRWQEFSVTTPVQAQDILPGSKEEFITEHYWGYTRISDSVTAEYEVKHPKWQVYPVHAYDINVDFEAVYGTDFSFLQQQQPESVFLAEGSEIKVMKGKKL